ncbi:uncharacterized protein LOC106468923 [Limulus polyphemus]|uniref:Uncharacterized protein LOC106468923 n=1 Tax=Limulus polyphemus TaxID=6850 RepID=A0ABM1BM71_LIMPO|nr:uncharacterized protein LOC106468923 [Limulus polyphemus]
MNATGSAVVQQYAASTDQKLFSSLQSLQEYDHEMEPPLQSLPKQVANQELDRATTSTIILSERQNKSHRGIDNVGFEYESSIVTKTNSGVKQSVGKFSRNQGETNFEQNTFRRDYSKSLPVHRKAKPTRRHVCVKSLSSSFFCATAGPSLPQKHSDGDIDKGKACDPTERRSPPEVVPKRRPELRDSKENPNFSRRAAIRKSTYFSRSYLSERNIISSQNNVVQGETAVESSERACHAAVHLDNVNERVVNANPTVSSVCCLGPEISGSSDSPEYASVTTSTGLRFKPVTFQCGRNERGFVAGRRKCKVQRIGVFYCDTPDCGVVTREKQSASCYSSVTTEYGGIRTRVPEKTFSKTGCTRESPTNRTPRNADSESDPRQFSVGIGESSLVSLPPATSEVRARDSTEENVATTNQQSIEVDFNAEHPETVVTETNETSMTQRGDRRNNPPPQTLLDEYTHVDTTPNPDVLPDILNSHLPPSYTTLPPPSRSLPPPLPHVPPMYISPASTTAQCSLSPVGRSVRGGRSGFRPLPSRGRNRSLTRGAVYTAPAASENDEPKHCCGLIVTQAISIRWFIAMIAFVGLCCAVVGTVLGALKTTGREHLTVSLLMIGVGIVLITVSGIAMKLTSQDAPSCRAMLGIQSDNPEPNRRFVPRVPPYGRPHHPYGAMMYPEFQHRPPPPSYQASMQEYRLRLLLLDRQQGALSSSLSPVSPPPTYRSHPSSTLQRQPLNLAERECSRPPSYRSRASSGAALRASSDTLESRRNDTLHENGGSRNHTSHSRNASLTLSFLSHESLFVDSNHSRPTDLTQSSQAAPLTSPSDGSRSSETDESLVLQRETQIKTYRTTLSNNPQNVRKNNDIHRVTIVQTTDSSHVVNQDAVVVSVNGQTRRTLVSPSTGNQGEVEILAHV